MRSDPRQRAQRALSHPQFRQLVALIPPGERDNPRLLLHWLVSASEADPRGASTAAFAAAHSALHDLVAADGLRDRAASLYHNGKIQALAGDMLDWFVAHPEAAIARLEEAERNGELPKNLVYEARLCFEEARQVGFAPEPAAGPQQMPTGEAATSAYNSLIKASVERRLTAAENDQLLRLAEQRVATDDRGAAGQAAEEMAAHRRALGVAPGAATAPKAPGGEYERLISKVSISNEEHQRLLELATDRAIASGEMTQDDLPEETNHE